MLVVVLFIVAGEEARFEVCKVVLGLTFRLHQCVGQPRLYSLCHHSILKQMISLTHLLC